MQINKKYFILQLFVLFGISTMAHPFYVSICQVDFNEENQSLEISVKIFADDLLLGLEQEGKTKLYLGEDKEHPNTDAYIFEYLNKHLQFTVNNSLEKPLFIGKELEKDVVWTYVEIKNISHLNRVDVRCTLLTEILESQNNIIQITKNGKTKNLLLSKHKSSGSVVF